MFDHLDTLNGELRQFLKALDVDGLSGTGASELIAKAAEGERLCAGIRLLATRGLDETVVGGDGGERARADWLAGATGQTPSDAARDLETADRLDGLDATQSALRNGELSAV